MSKKKSTKARAQQKRRQKRTAKAKARSKAKAKAKAKSGSHLRLVDDDQDDRSDGLEHLPGIPDRRALEGTMARIFGGGSSGQPVDQAQQLMYEAWDAPNDRDAVRLAREAIRMCGCIQSAGREERQERGGVGRALPLRRGGG